MKFQWELSIGNLLTVFTIVISLFSIYGNLIKKFTSFEKKLNILFSWWSREISKSGTIDPKIGEDIQKFFNNK